MTDHVHLLVQGLTDESDFIRFMTRMRQLTAAAFSREFKERLWQRGYYERVLRNVDDTAGVLDYIAANPIKAGLVSEDEKYPYLWTPSPRTSGLGRRSDEVGRQKTLTESPSS